MKKLNRNTAPQTTLYPERIIQFGEGNFLRAFADWMIYTMNKKVGFNAGIVVVQPLPTGKIDTLRQQDGLYHVHLQGLDRGNRVDRIELMDVVSRVVNPYTEFEAYRKLAENPSIRFVISNTTEAGITFDPTCRLEDQPAHSYPGKLTQLLYNRFQAMEGALDKGWIIFPCELISDNGAELKKCIRQYIELWELGTEFTHWFKKACAIYSTLVDRIVPGFPQDRIAEIRKTIAYEDELVVQAEAFHLWVIEAPESVEQEFPAAKAGLNVRFVPSEKPYHERKVTLLNGPHTVLAPVGYLAGLRTVRECVEDPVLGNYIHQVMYRELMPALSLPRAELERFASDVWERFRNPYLNHYVTSILLNSFSKYKTRDLPGLKTYWEQHGKLPAGLVLGLAAILTCYKAEESSPDPFTPQDDKAILSLLSGLWQTNDFLQIAQGVCGAVFIWGEDLNQIPGLSDQLAVYLKDIEQKGMIRTVQSIL